MNLLSEIRFRQSRPFQAQRFLPRQRARIIITARLTPLPWKNLPRSQTENSRQPGRFTRRISAVFQSAAMLCATTALSSTGIIISVISFLDKGTTASTSSVSLAAIVSRSASWPTCLDFHISRKAVTSNFPVSGVVIGIL